MASHHAVILRTFRHQNCDDLVKSAQSVRTSRRYLGVRAPVPSSQQATQRACDAIGCPSSTAENSPDIGDKFPGHPSLARWLTSHHGLHTTSGQGQVAHGSLIFLVSGPFRWVPSCRSQILRRLRETG